MSITLILSAFTEIRMEQKDPSSSGGKRKSTNKKPRTHTTSLNKASPSPNRSVLEIGPPSCMKREINAYALANQFVMKNRS